MQKTFRLLLVAVAIIIFVVGFSYWARKRAHNNASLPSGRQPAAAAPNSAPSTPGAANQTTPPQETASASPNSPPSSTMVPQGPGPITEQPTANALSPHPPSGFVTPATQKFALYRQGDLTYRLNTQSGQACILLASEDLWRKPLVYQHGCANR